MKLNAGQLSPDWVCWLMGYPIGYTSPDPLEELLWLDWSVDPADMSEDYKWQTPNRVTTEKKHRVNRLKALGNAVVPQCVAFVLENMLDGKN